jgi:hypothetical protein
MSKILLSSFIISITLLTGCASTTDTPTTENPEYVIDQSDFLNLEEITTSQNETTLSEEEIAGLIQMREEEKLARDVYQKLGEQWNLQIMKNIAESEQTHTDSVKQLLNLYEIEDPATNDSIGSFTSPEMQDLYNTLIAQGEKSSDDALVVGATIEDLDIYDLEILINQTDNDTIKNVYKNLQKGSRNHLRAFHRQLSSRNIDYTPQYISESEYIAIISSEQERGNIK